MASRPASATSRRSASRRPMRADSSRTSSSATPSASGAPLDARDGARDAAAARQHARPRPERLPAGVVERLLDFLRLGVHPVVPEQGSVGASGDLAPLAHLALPLIGRGEAEVDGERHVGRGGARERRPGAARAGGQGGPGAAQRHAADDARRRARRSSTPSALPGTASVIAAMTMEALLGTDVAFAAAYHAARPHPGQGRVAAELRHLLRDSELHASRTTATRTRSRIRTRCAACRRSTAPSRDALDYARGVLEIEINCATDNPLVFPDGADVDPDAVATGGGTGHLRRQLPRPAGGARDGLRRRSRWPSWARSRERRTALLIDGRLSGLPPFLAAEPASTAA